ncbi:hypothetical protein AVEN_50260-1 [Araneus ventricosus]|uniref:Uncharacterized protein n=1 Tax=Araneus ventricosus TaxID=182803 RepID=A0A4Y2J087_ARAVE|nr:hypothetical protein AVEN_50260-1 [Araneus ventricosus]
MTIPIQLSKLKNCLLSQLSAGVFTSVFKENLVPDKCSFNFVKRKQALGHRESIRRKRSDMLCDSVILLYDNTHTTLKTQELPIESALGRCFHISV